ncbi:MAG: tetratricopeptide repeat protein [Deltaproteobacteria bacterium]|nr:tetratricopeptide repeat protein [Deltaproteobacteria bacterium]
MRTVLTAFVSLALVTSCAASYVMVAPSGGPLTFEEHVRLAGIYESKGNLDGAEKELRAALLVNSNDARPHFGMGNIYLKRRLYDRAEESYLKAIDLDPEKGVYFNNLGWVYVETGRPVIAQAIVTRGLTLDPARQYIYLDTLGVIETMVGNYEGAEGFFSRAAMTIPVTDTGGLINIYTHLYDLYLRAGRTKEAGDAKKKLDNLMRGVAPALPPNQPAMPVMVP